MCIYIGGWENILKYKSPLHFSKSVWGGRKEIHTRELSAEIWSVALRERDLLFVVLVSSYFVFKFSDGILIGLAHAYRCVHRHLLRALGPPLINDLPSSTTPSLSANGRYTRFNPICYFGMSDGSIML